MVTSTVEKDQGVTPKVSLSYDFTKDFCVYATASKGFRPGGGTGPVPTSGPLTCEAQLQQEYGSTSFVAGPISFKSDNVWSYELGEKLRLADNRVTVNGSGVLREMERCPADQLPCRSCGYIYTANAGDAHVRGGGARDPGHRGARSHGVGERRVLACGHWRARLSSTPGSIRERRSSRCRTGPSSESIAYRHGLTDQLALTARADNTYTGSRTDATFAINQLPSYDLTNVRAGIEADAGRRSCS